MFTGKGEVVVRKYYALSVQVCCRCGSALPLPPPSYALPSSFQLYPLVAPDENSHGYPGPPQASPAVNPNIHHRLPSTHQKDTNQMFSINTLTLSVTIQHYSPCFHSPCFHSPLHYYHPLSSESYPLITINIIFIII